MYSIASLGCRIVSESCVELLMYPNPWVLGTEKGLQAKGGEIIDSAWYFHAVDIKEKLLGCKFIDTYGCIYRDCGQNMDFNPPWIRILLRIL